MPTCTAITVNFGFKIRERLANSSNRAKESFPPERPIKILSPSSIKRYFTTPLVKALLQPSHYFLVFRKLCHTSSLKNRAQKYMKRMIYGRFNKIELCEA